MRHCSYCGAEYPDDVKACSVDGEPVVGESVLSAPEKPKPKKVRIEIAPVRYDEARLKPDFPRTEEEQELCTQCMTGNRPGSHFCRQCGAPLSSYAATGPFESLFAEGHLYRRAAEQPQRLIVVAGMWMIFGILALAGAAIAAMSWEADLLPGVLVGIGVLVASVILIAKTTKNYRNRRAPEPQQGLSTTDK